MSTRVVHCKREPFDVYIGRPSKWGNPFGTREDSLALFVVGSRDEAIDSYDTWIRTQPELMASLEELRDQTLGCWCKPSKRCHGDVLVKLLEEKSQPARTGLSVENLELD